MHKHMVSCRRPEPALRQDTLKLKDKRSVIQIMVLISHRSIVDFAVGVWCCHIVICDHERSFENATCEGGCCFEHQSGEQFCPFAWLRCWWLALR